MLPAASRRIPPGLVRPPKSAVHRLKTTFTGKFLQALNLSAVIVSDRQKQPSKLENWTGELEEMRKR